MPVKDAFGIIGTSSLEVREDTMARYKRIDMSAKFIPVDFSRQILPGSFEYALCHLIDHEIDLSELDARFRNDEVGAPAYSPALLPKIVLLAYSRGLVSSRAIEAACAHNVVFMAVSGDHCPHFTTIAAFVSELGEAIGRLFTQVLLVCDRQGLIGRQMFAIDGVKLPANASKAKSGTREDFAREAQKMDQAVRKMLERHREADAACTPEPSLREREQRQIEKLQREAKQMHQWLADHPRDRMGARGGIRKSNRTDNDSAKMATSKGVIQGYTGVAAVDAKHQIIVDAQACGTGAEQELLGPVVEAVKPMRAEDTVITADAGYHSEANLAQLAAHNIDAYIPDGGYRQRDARFADQQHHRDKPDPLYDKRPKAEKPRLFRAEDFRPAADFSHCICPAGKRLYRNGRHHDLNGFDAIKFTGAKRDCGACALRHRCLRNPHTTPVRQVALFIGRTPGKAETHTERMKRKIDSEQGREMISRRFATVEPVFGNLRHNKRL
ncbi:MAG: DDE transposase, partial [Hyphomicrobiaceae bacterium]